MNYQEALKRWGKVKLEEIGYKDLKLDTVDVQMEFDKGYACCSGRDESCYCSMAESPSADVRIIGYNKAYGTCSRYISIDDFNFVEVLAELVAVADGHITE